MPTNDEDSEMKKLLFKAAAGSILILPLLAQAQGAYVDANVGQAQYKLDETGITSVSKGSDPTAYKVGVGYNFSPNFGAELGYADLGSQNNVDSSSGVNVNTDIKTTATYLAATATAPIGDKFMVFGKLGASWNRTTGTGAALGLQVDASARKTGLLANVGAGYNFTDKIAATVQYDSFGHIDEANSRTGMWSVGGRFTF
jgi:OmpA-OmpF porin, OOP family